MLHITQQISTLKTEWIRLNGDKQCDFTCNFWSASWSWSRNKSSAPNLRIEESSSLLNGFVFLKITTINK